MTEDAVTAGLELSAVIRQACITGQSDDAVMVGLARLLMARASTPADLLAIVTTAHGLSRMAIELADEAADPNDQASETRSISMRAMSVLLHRAVEVLESATGIASETFSGGVGASN